MFKPVQKKIYPNGLVLLVQSLPQVSSVSVGVQINTGSREEHDDDAGLCHLIEHMVFQGTRKRSIRQLSRIISVVGGQIDACTGREATVIYSKVPQEHVGLAVDVIADMLFHSTLTNENLIKEKAVINEEIRMVDDTPDELIHDMFIQALWPGQSLGRTILGSQETLQQLDREKIKAFMKLHFQPKQMIVSLAGQLSFKDAQTLVEKHFISKQMTLPEIEPDSVTEQPPQSIWKRRSQEQVHLCAGIRTFPYADSRRLSLMALSTILGGGTNSRLFYEIRERRGLSYVVYSFTDFYRDAGLMGIYVACHPKNLEETLLVIKKQINKIAKEGVTDSELKDVKEQLKGNLKLSLETTSSHMWHMLYHETYLEKQPSLDDLLNEVDQLTKSDLRQVARDCFLNQPLTLAVLGPYHKKIAI